MPTAIQVVGIAAALRAALKAGLRPKRFATRKPAAAFALARRAVAAYTDPDPEHIEVAELPLSARPVFRAAFGICAKRARAPARYSRTLVPSKNLPSTPHLTPYTLHPKNLTLNPIPEKPYTLNPNQGSSGLHSEHFPSADPSAWLQMSKQVKVQLSVTPPP